MTRQLAHAALAVSGIAALMKFRSWWRNRSYLRYLRKRSSYADPTGWRRY